MSSSGLSIGTKGGTLGHLERPTAQLVPLDWTAAAGARKKHWVLSSAGSAIVAFRLVPETARRLSLLVASDLLWPDLASWVRWRRSQRALKSGRSRGTRPDGCLVPWFWFGGDRARSETLRPSADGSRFEAQFRRNRPLLSGNQRVQVRRRPPRSSDGGQQLTGERVHLVGRSVSVCAVAVPRGLASTRRQYRTANAVGMRR